MKYRCKCDDCRAYRKIRIAMTRMDRRGAALVNQLLDRLVHAEFDAEYYRMKHQGTWPGDNPSPPVVLGGWKDPKDWAPANNEGDQN